MLQRRPAASRETAVVAQVQRRIGRPGVVGAARGLSMFGEHAVGWIVGGAFGALIDRPRRREWVIATTGVVAAHAASVVLKRLARRRRPMDEAVQVLVDTPSWYSFPSSHATSTTAAAVLYGGLMGRPLAPVLVPPMLASRLVLGVHYPTDVLAGSALGALVGMAVRRRLRGRGPKR
ncbi:MAG: phosphatase PAP2 family protein [Pseudonocardiaceae bacterium]|nr:phosphatase PAP2 family protein [Pseudonocardiaceae bacterium]